MAISFSKNKLTEKVNYDKDDIDDIVSSIKKLTDRNNHTDAVFYLAVKVKERKFITIAKSIKAIHDAEGSIPPGLSETRMWLKNSIIDYLEKSVRLDKEQISKIRKAF